MSVRTTIDFCLNHGITSTAIAVMRYMRAERGLCRRAAPLEAVDHLRRM